MGYWNFDCWISNSRSSLVFNEQMGVSMEAIIDDRQLTMYKGYYLFCACITINILQQLRKYFGHESTWD